MVYNREEKREKKKKQLISIFISLVMISAVFGFAANYYGGGGSPLDYNGFKFTQEQNRVFTKVDGKKVYFSFLPQQLSDINVTGNMQSLKDKKTVYVTYDPNSKYGEGMAVLQYSFEKSFPDEFNIYITKALTNTSEFGLPIITCTDATSFVPVILLESGDMTRIEGESDCITLNFKSNLELYRVFDRLRYVMYGIME